MIYDLITLLDVLKTFKKPVPFWLKFFPRQINFTTDKIAFDRVNEDYRRLAPFVAPNVQGKILATEGYDTLEFKPAYVKPKHIIDPDMVLDRQAGEALGAGSLTPQQRRDAVLAALLERHADMHLMTREWMAARAIIDGAVTISGENYPAVTVDFRRDASLTSVLTGGAKWDQLTADPLVDIRNMRNTSRNLCGAVIRDLIFGLDSWAAFSERDEVKALLSNQARGSDTNFSVVFDGFEDNVEFLGELKGSNGNGVIRLWLYSGKYRDAADVLQDILDPGAVVGVSPAVEGVRCYGAIKDKSAGFRALEMFPKMWEDEDPPVEYIMTQSAPLMVPKNPNATFYLKVV